MNKIVISLSENNITDENILHRTTGITKIKLGTLRKATGSTAKFFSNMNCEYINPLWKTHKLSLEQLKEFKIYDIPVWIVLAAGNTYTSSIIAILNLSLDPIGRKYCQFKQNKYFKNSKSYLEENNQTKIQAA